MRNSKAMGLLSLAVVLSAGLVGCDNDKADTETGTETGETGETGTDEVGLALVGVTGDDIVINRLWIQGCLVGTNGATWTDVRRVLLTDSEPFELVTTMTDYQNASATPDCETGLAGVITFTQEVESLGVQVPVEWVDAAGAPAPAPAGLEAVTEGNGMEGIMTSASVSPETAERADQLNGAAFCGVTTWQVGQSVDALLCFNGGYEPVSGKTVLVVDDRTTPWKNYQASPTSTVNEDGFQTQIPNALPFEGPFDP